MPKKLISVVTPCYNEEGNIVLMINKIKSIFDAYIEKYDLELIVIDNASVDNTVALVKEECRKDKRVKLIVNSKNFGWIKSPYHALLQTSGEAVIFLASDFQDPPDLIPRFLEKWEEGFKMVIGIKEASKENPLMFAARKFFYKLLSSASDGEPTIKNFTGFGLYDKKFINVLRNLDDQYPYLRGLVAELGFERAEVSYTQPKRSAGKTSGNLFRLYDVAMLGFTSHTKLPLRLSAFIGFFSAILSLLVAVGYFVYKLIYWNYFEVGMAPLVIGMFFFSSIQLFFIGIIGEYIGAIHTQVRKRPLVIEKERINFD